MIMAQSRILIVLLCSTYLRGSTVVRLTTEIQAISSADGRIFDQAKVTKGHAHRFRGTFAVELLLEGVPMERVAMLLGHQSIKITEKHYSPWVRARQEQVEADVSRVWSSDPLVLLEAKRTPQAREKSEATN